MPSSVSESANTDDGSPVSYLRQPWTAMSDLAEAVDDLICSFDYMDTAMDNLAMLIFIWILLSIATLGIAKWLYSKYAKPKVEVKEEKPKSINEIVNSTDSVLATSAKVKSAVFAAKPKPVPATPPNKKRLSRMSPGPDRALAKRAQSLVVPTATGPDAPAVQWVNDMFMWLYNDLVIVNELIQQWIFSMNDFSKKSVEEQGIGVELVRALDCHPPTVTNVFVECDSKDDVTITCDCDATPAFQLKAFSQKGDKVEVSHYRVNVNRFRARLSAVMVTEKLTGNVKCDGWPEVKILLAPVGPLRPNAAEHDMQQIINDIVMAALRATNLDLNFSQYPTCPRLRRHFESPPRTLPLHYDSMFSASTERNLHSAQSGQIQLQGDKRLLVKVVGAKDLGGKQGCSAAYCVVEMDEPPQKNQTAVRKDTNCPVWDEHFLFELSPQTAELLFEVYDKSGSQHRFLGLGLVGIEELLVSPSQRQLIGLQSRPMENEDVTGVITVEFLFIEGAEIPELGSRPYKLKESLRSAPPHGAVNSTNRTGVTRNGMPSRDFADSTLRDLKYSASTAGDKSTLVIHSVHREPEHSIKLGITESGKFIEIERQHQSVATDIAGSPESTTITSTKDNGDTTEILNGNIETAETTLTDSMNANDKVNTPQSPKTVRIAETKQNGFTHDNKASGDYVNHQEQSPLPPERTPRKKRNFFGSIRRRLGRSRTRGQSLDLPEGETEASDRVRSISAERNHHDSALSVPNRSAYSAGASPAQSGDESRTSRRSSISEVSGYSTASARTFIHEASTLVLETLEAGVKKHYLVPLAMAQRARWRRKGVKLHIYNEHTFLAKHLSGGTVCEVCSKTVARRLGKQGYECRDCQLKCHKHCHIHVPGTCPKSTVANLELSHSHSFGSGRSVLPVLSE